MLNYQPARNLTIAALSIDIDTILEKIFVVISDQASGGNFDCFYRTDDIPLQSDVERIDSRLQELGFCTSVHYGLEYNTHAGIKIMW
jgi:hypothetical protein